MDESDYLGQEVIHVALLPARAAYLIKAGSRSGFRRAIQEASTRWGGATEPILPVHKGGRVDQWWQQVADVSAVDAAVNVDLSQEDAEAAARRLGLRLVPLRRIDKSGPAKWTCNPVALPPGPHEQPEKAPVVARSSSPLWEAVAAGDLLPEYETDMAEAGLIVGRPRTDDWIARAQLSSATLLDVTLRALAEHSARGKGPAPSPLVLWVTKPNGLHDCLSYWNLRALRPLRLEPVPMLLLPHRGPEHWLEFDQQVAGVLTRPVDVVPDVVLCSIGVSPERLDEIADVLHLRRDTREPHTRHQWPPPPIRRAPYTYRRDIDPRRWVVFERSYGMTAQPLTQMFRTRTVIRFASPIEFTGPGYTLLRMTSPTLEAIPQRRTTAPLVEKNSTWRHGRLELRTSARHGDYEFKIDVPSLSTVTDALLSSATSDCKLSDKGRLGVALDEQGNVSILRQPGVLKLVEGLTTPRSRELLRQLKEHDSSSRKAELIELATQWGGRAARRYRTTRQLASQAVRDVVDKAEQLASAGWAERGLEVRCDRCGMPSFVPMGQVQDLPMCPACGAPAAYTTEEGALAVVYRLNALVDRASDQGVLPHLLVVSVLRHRDSRMHLLPGVDVWFADGTRAEVDLFGVHAGHVVAGEVKTSAARVTADQIERDVELSRRLGADIHVLATLEQLPTKKRAFAKKAADTEGLALQVLDASDLIER